MAKVRIIGTGEIKEVGNATAKEMVGRKQAEYVRKTPLTPRTRYATRQIKAPFIK